MLYAQKHKLKKKALIITLITLASIIVIAGASFGIWVVSRNYQYQEAIKAYDSGDVESAHSLFKKLGSFRDAPDYVKRIELEGQNATLIATLKDVQIGDSIRFGSYEQDNDLENGDEEIDWIVLDREGDIVTLLAEKGLDCIQFNTTYKNVTWETCTLRTWLNQTFMYRAFSEEQRGMIVETETPTEINEWFPETEPGNDTVDRIYLLSISEAKNYFPSGSQRLMKPTAYALAKGCHMDTMSHNGWWWLRTQGRDQIAAVFITDWGSPQMRGANVDYVAGCVRPCMRIDVSLVSTLK